ncbi:MAG: isopentenyl-diphosphate Delta-isomerase [Woeseiaceae bacterium]|nr:isopentenyl-diphosphate Delta-isomerase [Woeseiaceae bacterium]
MQSANRIVSSEAEELILVDSNDNPVGRLSKAAAHDGDGRLHRAFSVFLFNARGELLLQQRGRDKRLWPGFWSNSCCSHPRVGESMEVATRRRLDDELNLESELEYVYRFKYQANYSEAGSEHELCHVFVGRIDDEVVPNANEIEAVKFVPAGTMADRLQNDPDSYTPWFKLEWRTLLDEHSDVLARYI